MSLVKDLSPSAKRVQDILVQSGHNLRVVEFSESTRTAQEAADRIGCTLGQIVKSLIFKGTETGRAVCVLTSGANRVDETKISEYLDESIGRADADFVRSMTGFAIGGVPPIGHSNPMVTFLDEDLFQYPTVWAAAGTPTAVFEVKPDELLNMTGAKFVRVK